MRRDLTTSTGDPQITAKNPAPRPEARWHGIESSNAPVFMRAVLICNAHTSAVVKQAFRSHRNCITKPGLHVYCVTEAGKHIHANCVFHPARAYGIVAGKLCGIDDGIAANVWCDAPPKTSKPLFPAHHLPGLQAGHMVIGSAFRGHADSIETRQGHRPGLGMAGSLYDHGVCSPGIGVSGLLTALLCLHPDLHQICRAGYHDCQGACCQSSSHLSQACA